MESKPQKPPVLFGNPFSAWTELAFKLWGFGRPPAPSSTPEKEVAVAVIPARPDDHAKRAQRNARRKAKAKRARR